ncbi:alpha/beta hydrolase fold domain-containing protein [Microbacterium sp. KR10-403]|uniref:alpha/beta hydrolase fold domain-containing protein n=1 Tax=Microbacterium sp. KR10-403 TaxID=3158581 RepID=UPI0032E50B58
MLTPADLMVRAAAWYVGRRGEPVDARTDIDTASLKRRFAHLKPVEVTDLTVAGPHGPVPVRLYRDPAQSAHNAFVWVHGGAFFGGTLDMPESNWVGLELAAHGIPTLSVDYHKALHGVKHPIPLDDVQAAWEHATAHADELFGTARVHLGGASAGGALIAGVALRLRDAKRPLPASLVLAYPFLHPDLPPNTAETIARMDDMPARLRFRPPVVHALAKHYARAAGLHDPYAFAGIADDLSGLPPTYILVAAIDDLRSSGDQFALQLRDAGVRVELFAERSATHGHLNHPEANSAQRSLTRIRAWIDAFS